MDKFTGRLTDIEITSNKPLRVQFVLNTEERVIDCLVADDKISHQILSMSSNKYTISVKGHFNGKEQLVIRELRVLDRA